jgi:large conductance mechanosensitive channel
MASNDPVLEGVGLTHLGSPKALLGKRGGPMLNEFRDFALRGNMLDMAVGIIIGVAFGRVVSSLVSDIIMPPIGLLTGRSDFSSHFINLSGKVYATLAEVNRLKNEPKPATTPTTKDCPFCLSQIPLRATRCSQCTSTLSAG